MKEIIKNTIRLSIIGLLVGGLVGLGMYYLSSQDPFSDTNGLVLQIAVSALYGMFPMGSSVVYSIESWSITKATVTHFVIAFGTFFVIGVPMGWVTLWDASSIIMVITMVVAYFIIWFIQYSIFKRKIRKLNKELEKRNNKKM